MTWSIVARDAKTGQLGIAIASGAVASGAMAPFIRSGVGAIASQGQFSPAYGTEGLRLLSEGQAPDHILALIKAHDQLWEQRQVHMIDAKGRSAGFTGAQCPEWSGRLFQDDCSVAGNTLVGAEVVSNTMRAFQSSPSNTDLAERLMAAMDAGQAAGGDKRGQRSAAIFVYGNEPGPLVHLQVDDHSQPLAALRQLFERKQTMDTMGAFNIPANETPEQAAQRKKQAVAMALAQPAQNVGQGLGQLGLGIMSGLQTRAGQGGAYPQAPATAQPSFGTHLMNLLTGNQNGGLY
jgi:uncharacterized Ntn-hydrolase superfamily protein